MGNNQMAKTHATKKLPLLIENDFALVLGTNNIDIIKRTYETHSDSNGVVSRLFSNAILCCDDHIIKYLLTNCKISKHAKYNGYEASVNNMRFNLTKYLTEEHNVSILGDAYMLSYVSFEGSGSEQLKMIKYLHCHGAIIKTPDHNAVDAYIFECTARIAYDNDYGKSECANFCPQIDYLLSNGAYHDTMKIPVIMFEYLWKINTNIEYILKMIQNENIITDTQNDENQLKKIKKSIMMDLRNIGIRNGEFKDIALKFKN